MWAAVFGTLLNYKDLKVPADFNDEIAILKSFLNQVPKSTQEVS